MTYDTKGSRSPARIVVFDWVRVLGIGWIIVHHADDYSTTATLRSWPWSATMDDLLTVAALGGVFALSGFLAVRSLRGPPARSALGFIRSRAIRIWLPFLLVLGLFYLGAIWRAGPRVEALNALMLGPAINRQPGTLWFVEALAWYYVTLALLVTGARLLVRYRLAASVRWALVGGGGMAIAVAFAAVGSADPRLFAYAPAFLVGALIASLGARAVPGMVLLGVLVGTLAGAFAFVWAHLHWGGVPLAWWAVLAAGIAVCACLGATRDIDFGRSSTPLVALSYASFAAFLSQRLFFDVMYRAAGSAVSPWVLFGLMLALIPLIYVVSYFVQKRYDALVRLAPSSRAQRRGGAASESD